MSGHSKFSAKPTLGTGNEVAIDRRVMDDSAAELSSVRVGVLEDDTRWIGRARSLGARVEGVAVREKWKLVPRTSGTLVS